jgi:asparagine synthase (glutamine-hydrolysing)
MCGIAGIVTLEPFGKERLQSWLLAMNALQIHRGPDGEGIWIDQ